MLKIGDRAPDFEFRDLDDQAHKMSDLLARGAVMVYFYPADFTPVCSRQACMFRDNHEDLSRAGVQVIGISPQGDESHDRFREKMNLPFPLVADTDKSIARAYGVDGLFGIGVRRTTFLVGTDGNIQDVVHAGLRVGAHAGLIERTLARLETQRTPGGAD